MCKVCLRSREKCKIISPGGELPFTNLRGRATIKGTFFLPNNPDFWVDYIKSCPQHTKSSGILGTYQASHIQKYFLTNYECISGKIKSETPTVHQLGGSSMKRNVINEQSLNELTDFWVIMSLHSRIFGSHWNTVSPRFLGTQIG